MNLINTFTAGILIYHT